MNKGKHMSAADKIAQELTAIPQGFQDKAIEADLPPRLDTTLS